MFVTFSFMWFQLFVGIYRRNKMHNKLVAMSFVLTVWMVYHDCAVESSRMSTVKELLKRHMPTSLNYHVSYQ